MYIIHVYRSEQSESSNDNIPSELMLGNSSPQPPTQSQTSDREIELQEEDDLQMAIAISLNEEENKVRFVCMYICPTYIISIIIEKDFLVYNGIVLLFFKSSKEYSTDQYSTHSPSPIPLYPIIC